MAVADHRTLGNGHDVKLIEGLLGLPFLKNSDQRIGGDNHHKAQILIGTHRQKAYGYDQKNQVKVRKDILTDDFAESDFILLHRSIHGAKAHPLLYLFAGQSGFRVRVSTLEGFRHLRLRSGLLRLRFWHLWPGLLRLCNFRHRILLRRLFFRQILFVFGIFLILFLCFISSEF